MDINKNDIVYYARIIVSTGLYEIHELLVRTADKDWFVGIDKKDKHAYLFYEGDIGATIFSDRKEALSKVKEAEKNKTVISTETYYEEYWAHLENIWVEVIKWNT